MYAAGCAERAALRSAMVSLSKEEPDLAHDLTELRRVSLSRLAKQHGDDPSKVAGVMDAFVLARSNVRSHFYADTDAALTALRASGLTIGACTNGNCDVTRHANVAPLFDFSVTAADAGASKPSPVPFWHAAAGAKCHVSQLVHV